MSVESGVISTANGNLTIAATGGGIGGGTGNYGFYVTGSGSTIETTGSGNISVTATGGDAGGSGSNNDGIYVNSANGIQTTGTGTITLDATGGDASGTSNYGVYVDTGNSITGNGGAMSITGTGGNGNGSLGVEILGGTISNTGAGSITINGNGGGNGIGGDSEYGVHVHFGGVISTVNGNITITGTAGGAGISANHNDIGFIIQDAGSTVETTGSGNISIIGTGGGAGTSGSQNDGIYVGAANGIQTTGIGGITLNGTGGTGSGGDNYGIYVNPSDSITCNGGAMSIIGTGGNSSGNSNHGIYLNGGSITNTGSGTLTITGTGGGSSGYGVYANVSTGSSISIDNGNATITGTGSGQWDIYLPGLSTSGTGTFSLTGNGTGVNNGVAFGANSTYDYYNWLNTFHYSTAGNLELLSSISKTTGGDATLTLAAPESVILGSNVAITSTSGKLDVTLDADTAGNGGDILMNSGSGITSNGGNITLGGGSNPATGYAISTAGAYGIELAGNNTMNAGVGTITMRGSAGGAGTALGIYMGGGNDLIETTTGNILLAAQSEGGGEFELDLGTGTAVTTQTGSITLTGTAPNVSDCFNCIGVLLNSGATISSTGSGANVGAITITGTAYANGGSFTFGIQDGATISSVDANINITGTSESTGLYTPTNGLDFGIDLGGSITSTGAGKITITGIGDINNSKKNYGIDLNGGLTVSAHDGSITMTGTGGGYGADEAGIGTEGGNNQILSTGTAPIILTGIGANGSPDIEISTSDNVIGGPSAGGNITFNADTLNFSDLPTIETTGTVIFTPRTASTTIGVAGGSGTLQLTSGILSSITAGGITIGSTSDTGAMDVDAYTWNAPLSLYNGSGSITLDGMQTMGNYTFLADTAGNITLESGATLSSNATGNAIVVAAGHDFINDSGSNSPFVTPNGRFIGYSYQESSDTNLVTYQQGIVGYTYSTLPPSRIAPPLHSGSENTWVYAITSESVPKGVICVE